MNQQHVNENDHKLEHDVWYYEYWILWIW